MRIDVTDDASVAAAAREAQGVTLLVNNAGSGTGADFLEGSMSDIRLEMETHYFGTLAVTRAFAPQLAAAPGESGVLNVLSVLSWLTRPGYGGYSAAKSAAWSLTNALRTELATEGTQVTALHVSFMDTDMVRHVDAPKLDPALIAALALDGVEAGADEVLADDITRGVRAGLSGPGDPLPEGRRLTDGEGPRRGDRAARGGGGERQPVGAGRESAQRLPHRPCRRGSGGPGSARSCPAPAARARPTGWSRGTGRSRRFPGDAARGP